MVPGALIRAFCEPEQKGRLPGEGKRPREIIPCTQIIPATGDCRKKILQESWAGLKNEKGRLREQAAKLSLEEHARNEQPQLRPTHDEPQ